MKKKFWKTLAAAAAFSLLGTMSAWAEARFSVSAPETVGNGQEFTVQVFVSSDDPVNQVETTLVYDDSVISYVRGDEGARSVSNGHVSMQQVDESGMTEKSWTITFRSTAEGYTDMQLENTYASSNADGEQQVSNTPTALTVSGTGTPADATQAPQEGENGTIPADPAAVPSTDPAAVTGQTAPDAPNQALVDEINNDSALSCLYNNEKWMAAESFDPALLPPYFVSGRQFYKGVEIQTAQLGESGYHMAYITREDGSSGQFVRYDEETKTFSDPQKLEITPELFLYVITPESVPQGFSQIMLDVEQKQYNAYQNPPMAQNNFCILYGVNQNGLESWFTYDAQDHSLQRYVAEIGSSSSDASAADLRKQLDEAKRQNDFIMECIKYVGIALAALLFLLLIINVAMGRDKSSKKRVDFKDDYEDMPETRRERKAREKKEKEIAELGEQIASAEEEISGEEAPETSGAAEAEPSQESMTERAAEESGSEDAQPTAGEDEPFAENNGNFLSDTGHIGAVPPVRQREDDEEGFFDFFHDFDDDQGVTGEIPVQKEVPEKPADVTKVYGKELIPAGEKTDGEASAQAGTEDDDITFIDL